MESKKVFRQRFFMKLVAGFISNGIILAVIFKEDRSYPYLKIKWDSIPVEPEKCKKFYDTFDVTKEIKLKNKVEKKKKTYENFYLNERRNAK